MSKKADQVSKNGDFLRYVADWFEEMAARDKSDIKTYRRLHATRILDDQASGVDTAKYQAGQVGRGAGFLFFKLFEFISRTTNIAFVDNAIIRKAEEKYSELKRDDKKFEAWLKKHPALSSYLTYYLTLSLLTFGVWGGSKIYKNRDKKVEPVVEALPTVDLKSDVKTYDVTSDTFVQDFITNEWNNIVIALLEFETYRSTPVLQGSESRYTYGPGLTWVWEKDNNGNWKQQPCVRKWKDKAARFTQDEVWNQVKIHLSRETLLAVKNQLVAAGRKDVQVNQILALMIAGYQTSGHIPDIVQQLNEAGDDIQQCADAFAVWKKSHNNKNYDGTMKRRWWCAAIYLGYVDSQDLLSLNRDVFSAVNINTIKPEDKSFQMDYSTIVYALLKTNGNNSVQDFITQHTLLENPEQCYVKTPGTMLLTADPAMHEMVAGLTALHKKDYESAIEHYNQAIALNPDNIDAYSDLILVYKTYADGMSDRNAALLCYQSCYGLLDKAIKQMNSNSELVIDNNNMVYMCYNVGNAQEAIAQIYKDMGDINNATYMYKYAGVCYGTAESYAKKAEFSAEAIQVYTDHKVAANRNYKQLKNGKTTAFQQGKAKLKTKIMQEQQISTQNTGNEYA